MKSNHAVRLLRTFGVAAMMLPIATSLEAQNAPATPGEFAVFSNLGGVAIATDSGDINNVEFSFDELTGGSFAAPTADIILSQGKYLVLYSTRLNNVSGANRAEAVARLTLEAAGAGTAVALPYGLSQGYIRNAEGADNTILSGGTVVEAGSNGDILRLQVERTDANVGKMAEIVSDGTSIQLLKLDDTWDYLRLGQSSDLAAATTATFEPVVYDVIDEPSSGSMSFTAGNSGITLNEAGRYLVLANTHLRIATQDTRTGYTQRLTLNGAPLTGSHTTTYIRGNPNTNGCEDGVTAVGMIVAAAAGQILNVETSKESGLDATIVSSGSGLAIVQLPSIGQFISLSDTSGQEINPATRTPMTWSTQVGIPGTDFSHTIGGSAVTVNTSGRYLFLGTFFTDDDGTALDGDSGAQRRQVPWLRFAIDGADAFWGGGSRYSRDLNVNNNGNWAGVLLDLFSGSEVEMTMGRLGADGTSSGDSMGLQAVNIDSLFPSADPEVALSVPLNLVVSTAGTIGSSLLQAADANSAPADLTFTVTSAPSGGTLRLNGSAIGVNGTFTQADIDNELLTFDAGPTVGSFDFNLTVADEDGGPTGTGSFTVVVGLVTVTAPDAASTDEDTAITTLDGGAASVLDNDIGTDLIVSSFDAVSAQGALVNVNLDGTFSYNPSLAGPLQALAVGEQVVDTFTCMVTDFANNTAPVTVSVTVTGVNDAPVLANESLTQANASGSSANLLGNDRDTDASDVLRVTNLADPIFGQGGAVGDEMFNFEFVPLEFTTNLGATVRIAADGSFEYDPSTSSVILGLAPGVSIPETFTYEVFDGSVTLTATVTVTSIGLAQATNDYGTTDADSSVTIAVLDNDEVRKPGGVLATPTPGAVLEFLADGAGNTSAQWINTGSATLASIPDGGVSDATLNTAIANPPPGISAAYNFAGVEGIPHLDVELAAYGDIDAVNSTIEVLFRPSDQVGEEVVWEVGGTTDGSSLTIVGDKVVWTSVDNANQIAQAVAQLPAGAMAGGDFVHAVATIDLTTSTAQLFINGGLAAVGSGIDMNTGGPGNLDDWCGTDDGGVGRHQTDVGGDIGALGTFGTLDLGALTDFAGEVAVLRAYSTILNPAQILNNYNALYGTPLDAVPTDLDEIAGTASPSVGSPIALPSGATVTLEADGRLTYDPNGAFAGLGQGLTARDSFTYRVGGSQSPVTVHVDVTGTNPDPQITISAVNRTVNEGGGTVFTISSSGPVSGIVIVDLSYSGLADRFADFTGQASVQIGNGGTSVLSLSVALNDGRYEGTENMIVSVAGVTGNAVLGGTTSAETLLIDAQSPPEFSIAADQAVFSESGPAVFTVTPTVPSQAPRTLTLDFGGTASQGYDYFGPATIVIPGGAAATTLEIPLLDDALAEGNETLAVTLTGVDTGTIGAGDTATVTITDGSAACLFMADFEGIDSASTPNGMLTGFDAPFAADLGTSIGSWSGVFTVSSGGDAPGVIPEDDDTKGDGVDFALRLDRPGPGEGDVFANLAAPVDFATDTTAVVSLDLGSRRTQGNTEDKSFRLIGLDDFGEKSFELFVSANNNAPIGERLYYADSGGALTEVGNSLDFDNTNGWAESRQTRLIVYLTAGGYQVAIDRWPIDGVPETVSGVLPYAGSATQISRIHFALSGSSAIAESSGIIVDDLKVSGTAGNVGPSATLDATSLASGGMTFLPDSFIGTGTLLDTLQVDDPDSGAAAVTATFESTGAAPLTFSATGSGSATVGGNGSGTLTINGPIADVNATLAAGVTYTTSAVTGGDAAIQFTISDNGNTGPGGAKTLTHRFSFFVNEGPTVTIDRGPGQPDRTGTAPIVFSVAFSEAVTGFTSSDADLSQSTAGGTLVANVSGSGASYTVSVTGMTSFGDVILSVPEDAANAVAGGAGTEASKAVDDSVTFVPNSPPLATNLTQSINYVSGPVDIGDIFVVDPNDSVVTTTQTPQVDFPAADPESFTLTPDPATDEGFALQLVFTPSSLDVSFGTVRVFDIGGSSNGNGVYLIDGTPYFIRKMNSDPGTVPEGLDDPDMANGNICIPLASGPLAQDETAILALVASLDSVTYSLNGMGAATVPITNRTTQSNWSGDDTVRIGQFPTEGPGGLGTVAGVFDETVAFEMLGTVSLAQMWHAPDTSGYSIQAVDAPEELTATLSLPVGDGDLTAPAGSTWNPATGVWTVTGGLVEVNVALADVQFLPNGISPVTVSVLIDDGDEDGSGPLTGSIVLFTGDPGIDTDSDGIPDSVETANGLNPSDPNDASSDGDGDGWTALDEYLMGTGINDRNSSPVFDVVHVSASEVQIIYGPILSGRTYQVIASTDGQSFPTVVDSFTAGANAATNTATDSSGNLPAELYKLQVIVP